MAYRTSTIAIALACMTAFTATASPSGFVAGRIYSSTISGFLEWNTTLQVTRTVPIDGLDGASGLVFNSAGNLVMIGRYQGAPRLLEVNSAGQVLQSALLNTGPLLLGSYVDYHPGRNQYIVAEGQRVRLLNADFTTAAISADTFGRASGVAFASDGNVYASDQLTGTLTVLNPSLQPVAAVAIGGFINTGMELASNGDLLLTAYGSGTIRRWRPPLGPISTIVSGLPFGTVSDVDQLPDGRIVSLSDSNTMRLYSDSGQLLATGTANIRGDGVAYFVPTPGATGLLTVVVWVGLRRRR